jgi:XisH protein
MAKDLFHQAVRTALEKDGWTITDDPHPIRVLGFDLDVDLGAERILAAERNTNEKSRLR